MGGVASTSLDGIVTSLPRLCDHAKASSCTSVGSLVSLRTVTAATGCFADSVTRTGFTLNEPACATPILAKKMARPRRAWPRVHRFILAEARGSERDRRDHDVRVAARRHVLAGG